MDNDYGLTPEELGAVFAEAESDDGPLSEIAGLAKLLAEAVGEPLPVPSTPWERDALVESAKRKIEEVKSDG